MRWFTEWRRWSHAFIRRHDQTRYRELGTGRVLGWSCQCGERFPR